MEKLLDGKYKLIIAGIPFLVMGIALNRALGEEGASRFIDTSLYLTYALMIVLAVGSLAFFVLKTIQDPKSAVRLGISVAVVVLVLIITWFTASTNVDEIDISIPFTVGEFQLVGAMTNTTWVLCALGAFAVIFFEAKKAITNG